MNQVLQAGFLAVAVLLHVHVAPVRACSCIGPPSPQEALEQSDAVFSGTIVEVDTVEEAAFLSGIEATFQIQRSWKGTSTARVTVATSTRSSSCGLHFEEGDKWLIYAHQNKKGALRSGLCSRSKKLARAQKDIAALDEATKPPGGVCGGSLFAALQSVAFVLFGVALLRRRVGSVQG